MRIKAVQPSRDVTSISPDGCNGDCDTSDKKDSESFFDLNDKMPCLWRIQGHYFQLYNIRRVMHKKEPVGTQSSEHPRGLSFRECNEQYTKEIGVTKNFLESAFPEFCHLEDTQKSVLFKNFFATFLVLEPCYFAQIHNRRDVWLMASGDFVYWDDPEKYFTDEHDTTFVTKKEAIRLFNASFEYYKRNTFDSWSRYEVKDIEFYALISFILWEVETEEVAEKCRQRITKELVYYYKNVLRDSNYGLRLTNLMSLLQTNQRALRRWQEDTQIGEVFNSPGVGKTLYEYIMML